MAKDDTLQLRLDSLDMSCLREASAEQGMSLSEFVRHELEPSIVARKVAAIAAEFDFIVSVRLFGSMARREQREDSDIDLAIETDGPYKWMGEKGMGRFAARIEEATGRAVDVVKAKFCQPSLAQDIERDGRLVYER